jgi:hypothetical protein
MSNKTPTLEELRFKRIDLLNKFVDAKTGYLKNNLSKRLKSVNQQLFTLTKDARYL